MQLDLKHSDADNFGYPASLITCSTRHKVLSEYVSGGKSIIWRRPQLDPDISEYVKQRCADERYSDRMTALDESTFMASISAQNEVAVCANEIKNTYVGQAADVLRGSSSLTDIFPENEARTLVADIETRIREAAQYICRSKQDLTILFRTRVAEVKFHKDRWPVLGMNYTNAGTKFGPESIFRRVPSAAAPLFMQKEGAPLWMTQAGDVSYINLPHRSGYEESGNFRLWVGVYKIRI